MIMKIVLNRICFRNNNWRKKNKDNYQRKLASKKYKFKNLRIY